MTLRSSFWWLPNLEDFDVTSEPSSDYNCIAWALSDDSRWIDPTADYAQRMANVSNQSLIDSVVELFRAAGYELCGNGSLEDGYEKVAVYVKDGVPTHAARQLSDGRWTSKLGKYEDIEHDSLEALQGDGFGEYGNVVVFMIRPLVA
ncbi:MAG: hypothetical protein F4Y49_11505 [Dehalococcoidia bacterium]|nr:hypothetical protein [Dehalococcoidia bacterium]